MVKKKFMSEGEMAFSFEIRGDWSFFEINDLSLQTLVFILSTPADIPLFTFQVQTSILLWFAEYSRPIAATGLALVMTLGMMSIINNVQDIVRMRRKNAFIPNYSL